MALEKELETYNKNLDSFKEYTGKYVLISGARVVDFFSSYDDAIKAGYLQFGLQPFLVKQVNTTEAVQYITRYIVPAVPTQAAA